MVVEKSKKSAIVFCVEITARPNVKSRCVRLEGLKEDAFYRIDETVYKGSTLMQAGILIPAESGDYRSFVFELKEVE